ncbi:MAG: flagellar basal body rod C-terminal domain-containing protein [Desulfobacteraceae bacterium]
MTVQGVGASVSAIKGFGTKMASTANNVANSLSVEYKKSRVLMNEQADMQGVTVSLSRIETPGVLNLYGEELSNVDIAEEMSSMIVTQNGLDANAEAFKTMDEMAGSIIDIAE